MEAAIPGIQVSVAYCLHGSDYFLRNAPEHLDCQEKWPRVVVTDNFKMFLE